MAELGPLQGCHESTHARVTQPGMSSSEHGAYNDGRYFGRYFELGSCEALGCAEGVRHTQRPVVYSSVRLGLPAAARAPSSRGLRARKGKKRI